MYRDCKRNNHSTTVNIIKLKNTTVAYKKDYIAHQSNREFKINKNAFETHSLDYETNASNVTNSSGKPLF